MAAARQKLEDMSDKLGLAMSRFQPARLEVAALTSGLGVHALSEAAARVSRAAKVARTEAGNVLKAADEAEAAATSAMNVVEAANNARKAAENAKTAAEAAAATRAAQAAKAAEEATRAAAAAAAAARAVEVARAAAAAFEAPINPSKSAGNQYVILPALSS